MVRMSHPGTPRRADPLQMRIIGPVRRVALQLPADLCDRYVRDRHAPWPGGPRDAAQQADRLYTAVMAKESNSSPNVPLTKQAAGAVTGAVAGSIVAGPAGAIVGGVAGAVMGNRVGQGKPAVPTKAVAAATSVAKQVSRIPVGKAVGALTAKAGVLKKTTKKTAAKKTSARKTNAKKAAARTAAKKSVSRLAARSRSAKKSVRR